MNIIIAGMGKGGNAVLRQLLADGHSLTVIDKSSAPIKRATELLDNTMGVTGDCLVAENLEEAGIRQAKVLIAFTGSDETNLLCCLAARKLNPKIHTIPRIRTPECYRLASDLRDELRISMIVSPDRNAAKEIYSQLQFPEFIQRESFAKGRIDIVQLRIKDDSKLCGVSVTGLSGVLGCKVLVCAVIRDGEAFIPKGDHVFHAGDSFYITAPSDVLSVALGNLGITHKKVKHVMIVGGDRTSVHLMNSLEKSGVSVKLIESNPERCSKLEETFRKVIFVNDDGSSQEVLDREGCSEMDALITLTGLDEVNMVVSMYGVSRGVEKVITKINRIESPSLLNGLNIGGVVSSTQISAGIVTKYVRAMKKQNGAALTFHPIAGGQVIAMEFNIDETTKHIGTPLKEAPIRKGVLITSITHNANTTIADGESSYQNGDVVVVIAPADVSILQFNDIFS